MRRWAWIVMLAVVMAGPALAQTDRTGVIEGRLLDDRGQAVGGAVVMAARPDGSYPGTAVTGNDGRFRIGFLPPGSYNVSVTGDGFNTKAFTGVTVRAGQTTPLDVAMERLATLTETITVVAEAPLIDAKTTEYSTILSGATTETLPTTRNANDLIEFVPGARPSQVWGGSTEQANVYQIDGVNVTDPGFGGDFLLPNPDWIEEFQVRGLGAGAEYGNFTGGLVNIVTKSGSNTFEGVVRFNYEDASLNSSNVNALENGEELDNRMEVNASVAGPFIKDKLYYFFSAQGVTADTKIVDADSSADDIQFQDVEEERFESKLYGKLTWQATRKDTFNVVLGMDNITTDNRFLSVVDDPEAATNQDSPATFWNFGWQRVFGSNSFLEVKYTGYTGDDDREPLNGEIQGVRYLSGGDRKRFRNADFDRQRTRENNALTVNYDWYVGTGRLEHHLKFGGEYNLGTWNERLTRTGGITWRPAYDPDIENSFDPDDPGTWLDPDTPEFVSSDWGGGISLDTETVNAALWVQDYITITPRLNASVGLRYGLWEGTLNPVGGGDSIDAIDDTGWDPRIGLTWDILGDQKWVAKAHWGRFHQNLFALFFDRVEGGNVFQDELYFDWIADPADIELDRAYPLPDPDDEEDPWEFFGSEPTGEETGPVVGYEQPYVDQWVLGLERAFGNRWKAGATYIRRDFENIVGLIDRNLDQNYLRYTNVRLLDGADPDTGDPLRIIEFPEIFINVDDAYYVADNFGIAAPGLTLDETLDLPIYDPDYELTVLDDAERSMDQVQLIVARQGERLSFNASVVWTDIEGNFYSVNGYDDPSGTGAGPFVNPNEQVNFAGNMPNYAEWEAKLSLTARLPWQLRLGTFFRWDSGDFYSPSYELSYRDFEDGFTGAETGEGSVTFADFDGNLSTGQTADGESFDFDHFFLSDGDLLYVEPRGSRDYEDLWTLDVHLDRPFRLSKNLVLGVSVDVFNLFNADAVTSLDTRYNFDDPEDPGSSPFGEVRLRQAPRTIRLGASLSW